MARAKSGGGLELEDHPRFQQLFWRAERVAWLCFVLILIAALLGFTGSGGVFADRTIQLSGAKVVHPKVFRWQTPDTIALEIAPGSNDIVVAFDKTFLERFEIRSLVPEPATSETAAGAVRARFARGKSPAPSPILIHVEPLRPALAATARMSIAGEPVTLRFSVLP
jgi:hypothetical protein